MPNRNVCSVADCKNNSFNSQVKFHRFPKEKRKQKQWIQRCRRQDKINMKNARVCSDHFSSRDYERDLMNELLGLKLRKILKSSAVPSRNIPNWHGPTPDTSDTDEEIWTPVRQTRNMKKLKRARIEESTTSKPVTFPVNAMRCHTADTEVFTDLKDEFMPLYANDSTGVLVKSEPEDKCIFDDKIKVEENNEFVQEQQYSDNYIAQSSSACLSIKNEPEYMCMPNNIETGLTDILSANINKIDVGGDDNYLRVEEYSATSGLAVYIKEEPVQHDGHKGETNEVDMKDTKSLTEYSNL